LFVLRDEDGGFVGRVGLRFARPLGVPEVEVAYALGSRFWGRGYAVSVTTALCSLADEAGPCTEIVAFTETSNRQSWRVMQKAGFAFDRQFFYQGTPHVLYRRQL
jgi:[ribosomal protein S5]-alanine N-acetyltransferase